MSARSHSRVVLSPSQETHLVQTLEKPVFPLRHRHRAHCLPARADRITPRRQEEHLVARKARCERDRQRERQSIPSRRDRTACSTHRALAILRCSASWENEAGERSTGIPRIIYQEQRSGIGAGGYIGHVAGMPAVDCGIDQDVQGGEVLPTVGVREREGVRLVQRVTSSRADPVLSAAVQAPSRSPESANPSCPCPYRPTPDRRSCFRRSLS